VYADVDEQRHRREQPLQVGDVDEREQAGRDL